MTETLTNYDGFCIRCKQGIEPNKLHFAQFAGHLIPFGDVICMDCAKELLANKDNEGRNP